MDNGGLYYSVSDPKKGDSSSLVERLSSLLSNGQLAVGPSSTLGNKSGLILVVRWPSESQSSLGGTISQAGNSRVIGIDFDHPSSLSILSDQEG